MKKTIYVLIEVIIGVSGMMIKDYWDQPNARKADSDIYSGRTHNEHG